VRVQMLSDTNEQNVTDLLPFITMVEVLLEYFTWDEILKEYFCSADPDIVQHRSFSCAGPIGGEVDEEQEAHLPPKRGRNGANRMAFKSTSSWQRMLDSNALMMNTIDDERSRDGKYFRRRFRMPYSLFKSLIAGILRERWFPKFGPQGEGPLDAAKNRGATLQVKVLSARRRGAERA
jgi:hypothetical protein